MKKTIFFSVIVAIGLTLSAFSHIGTASSLDSDWHIRIVGTIQNTLDLTVNDLAQMPRTTVQAQLSCYGNLLQTGNWTGVQLGFLIEQARVDFSGEGSIDFSASDGYQINDFPMSAAERSDVIIAYELNGAPLSEQVRLVVPGSNGNVWISMIIQIAVQSSAGLSLAELTPPLVPKANVPSTPLESPVTQPSQPAVQPSPPLTNTTETMPQQPEQNQTAPETTDAQSNSLKSKQEPSGSTLSLEYVFASVVVVATTIAAVGIVITKHKKFRK